jgi:class 3 adenylate cyclase/tetratricopeptide (TPR) repeat protein
MAFCTACGVENQADARFCKGCGTPLAAAPEPREQRKTVTVLFCDVVGSTGLGESIDPEALRALLARYFERMRGIVEAHGGSVEKFIGDAVMTVFGVPASHEDDALRACRAAVEMRDALPELGIQGRIGVDTGEVVTGTEERLATGDAVNVAARLEQAAGPGEVLVGAETLRLVRSAVEVGEPRLLELKGKAEPVTAYPLVAVTGELERLFASPMVGRENELGRLRSAFTQAVQDRSCQLFTVLGSAGVGKSRLAAEFLALVEARVVRGRCLSYGEGITYWPVVEILKQFGSLPEGDATRPLRSLLGEADAPASAAEIAWGFRKLLEQEAQERPVICVFDDIHWAEETLLDLVEHVADLSRDASLLVLCMARPELLERRPSWGGGKWNATTVLLESLDAAESVQLLAELGGVSDELRERIVQVAEGNPLFIEETLALVRESADGEVEVPPTIQALLAARLDQLDPAERSILERGSVEGRTFHRGAVVALVDGDGQVDQRLVALVRKELVRPDRGQLSGDDAYRFRHLLIRDAAYDALPKATRADLHRRFADWLEQHGQELVELEEILGYHLEQAARYLDELGQTSREFALEAGERLSTAGRRAFLRGDWRSAVGLLERALVLMRPYRFDAHLEAILVLVLEHTDAERGVVVADAAAERAVAAGDESGELLARTVAAKARLHAGNGATDELERLALAALPALTAAGDEDGLVHVWLALALVANMRSRYADWAQATEQVLLYARRTGQLQGTFALAVPLTMGPRPASEALSTLDAHMTDPPHPVDLILRALLLAMLDRFDEARAIAIPAEERAREYGFEVSAVWLAEISALAGDYEGAAIQLRSACDAMEAAGSTSTLSTYAPRLGRVLCVLGRHKEAEALAQQGRELGDPEDNLTQAWWRQTQALVHSERGEHAEAERLAREAVDLSNWSDSLLRQGDALFDLGEVLKAAGRHDEAAAAFGEAHDHYQQKQAIPLARRTHDRLAALEEAPA